ncbi:HNH endonuclease signature motif containing protein [Microtetraspora fusca]|uniref:HNH endonuclease signature motif containing protein n=1 Tax=Microtetraspora fusca TaxID=1997 RepID=A0ABW6VIW7_MICFU
MDHITNWSDGGATDLDNLGPTCQFHNRDRYRNPERYRLHRVGKDRWGFTYLGPRNKRR